MKSDKLFYLTGGILGTIFLIALLPLAYIWGWNQLFGKLYMIDYTFWNWLGVVALSCVFNTKVARSK